MAEYAGREKNYSKTLGDLVGTYTTECVKADSMSKDEAAGRAIRAFALGNFDVVSKVSLIGMKTPLKTNISVPKAIVMNLNPLVVSEAVLETSMSVSASQESEHSKDTSADIEGEGTGGYGPIKVKVKVHAHTAVHSTQKRSSDYRATCDTKLTMVQGETPEGINRILDALLLTVDKGMEINEKLIDRQAQQLTAETDTGGSDDTTDTDDTDMSDDTDTSDDLSTDDTSDDMSDDISDDNTSSNDEDDTSQSDEEF